MACIINSTMGSSLPSLAIPNIAQEFGVTSQTQLVLPISSFLIGYVFGPLLCRSFPKLSLINIITSSRTRPASNTKQGALSANTSAVDQ